MVHLHHWKLVKGVSKPKCALHEAPRMNAVAVLRVCLPLARRLSMRAEIGCLLIMDSIYKRPPVARVSPSLPPLRTNMDDSLSASQSNSPTTTTTSGNELKSIRCQRGTHSPNCWLPLHIHRSPKYRYYRQLMAFAR